MFNWLREYLEIKYEFREKKNKVVVEETVCKSCETLRQQLEIANYEKSQLLSKILKEPTVIPDTKAPDISIPRVIPWTVRKQMLEREDREKARLLRNAPKPDSVVSTDELEKDLKIAEENREKEGVK